MKVYIAVDSEGSTCVVREPHPETVYGTWQADFIRAQATAEACAAVEGARSAGATDSGEWCNSDGPGSSTGGARGPTSPAEPAGPVRGGGGPHARLRGRLHWRDRGRDV